MDQTVSTGTTETAAREAGNIFRGVVLLLALALLSACGGRPETRVIYPHPQALTDQKTVTIYVATSREQASPPVKGFTTGRSGELSYAAFTIAIPPNHVPGQIEWPYSAIPHPETEFTVVKHVMMTRAAFDSAVNAEAKASGRASLFVHGFNVSFQEGVFRLAQLTADTDVSGVPVLFSWPSQGRLLDYVTDKDSATFSRDGLTDVLGQMTRLSNVRSVTLFGHSMGGWLTMEALRQLALKGDRAALKKLNVILAAPDIDEDVFNAQLDVVGPLSPPLLVMVSADDRALQASRLIQGNHVRAGQLDITDPEVVAKAREKNVLLLDISSVSSSDALNHSRYVNLAAIYPQLEDVDEATSPLRSAGALIFNTVGNTISAPFTLAGEALSQ